MFVDQFLFLVFSIFIFISAFMVITLKNAVHSVLFLILVFCNTAGLLLLLGAEFLAFMILIVYVGAIAVLFLFVVMMLNIKTNTFFQISNFSIFPLGGFVFILLIFQILSTFSTKFNIFDMKQNNLVWISWFEETFLVSNVEVVGQVLYTDFSLLFLLSSLILLVAMIGAIVLTMHQRINTKKQKIEFQLTRDSKGVLKFINLRN